MASRSGTASTACSKRSAMFSAMGMKLERVIVRHNRAHADLPRRRSPGGVLAMSATTAGQGEEPHALVELRGHVLIVTMNRPHARNALSGPMMAIMREAWDRVDDDPGV